jgi:ferric-dicitrate binding protein FerR (iron transport regulator)
MDNLGEDIKLLIVGYLTGDSNQEEALRLMQWVNTNPQNREEFNNIKTSWELAGMKRDKERFDENKSWSNIQSGLNRPGKNRTIPRRQLIKIAATWLLLIAFGSMVTLLLNKQRNIISLSKTTEIIAPLGAKSIVTLPEGTKIWLNAGSKLVYNAGFNVKDRVVTLIGEAYFQVKTDKTKPFIVKTSDVIVRALGTRFNVKAYPDEKTITATLEEGKIDVQLVSSGNQEKIVLKPNENIVFYKDVKKQTKVIREEAKTSIAKEKVVEQLEVQENVKTILYTSWKEDKWIIESEPLSTLIPKLERKYNLTIAFSDSGLMNYKFSGSIKNETVEQILKALSFTAPVEYTIEKDTIILRTNQQLKDKFTRIITHKTKTN